MEFYKPKPKPPVPPLAGYKESTGVYMQRFNRSRVTIRNWVKQKAPLDDPAAMVEFLKYKDSLTPKKIGAEKKEKQEEAAVATGTKSQYQLKTEKMELDVKLAQHKLDVEMKKYVLRDEVEEAGVHIAAELDAELKRLETNIPGSCAGLSEVELQKKIKSFTQDLRENLRKNLLKYVVTPN